LEFAAVEDRSRSKNVSPERSKCSVDELKYARPEKLEVLLPEGKERLSDVEVVTFRKAVQVYRRAAVTRTIMIVRLLKIKEYIYIYNYISYLEGLLMQEKRPPHSNQRWKGQIPNQ
jgi:hypothetical protein